MLGKVMEKTQKIIETGAEKGIEIEEKPIKNTCEHKCQKRVASPTHCRSGSGEVWVPRTPTFKDLLRSRVHEVRQKEETQPLENEREGGEREERESAEDTKRRIHARLGAPEGPERIYLTQGSPGPSRQQQASFPSSCTLGLG